MIFTDWIFPFFLAAVFALHWIVRGKETRLWILLIASFVFYGWWDWRFLFLMSFVIVSAWFTAMKAGDQSRTEESRNLWMWVGVGVNLVVLGIFKYFGFFADSFAAMMDVMGLTADVPTLKIILPVGISFYTFQAISYMVDVRRGDLPADHRLRRVGLYIAFFPQLVAGPIVRAASWFPQMEKPKKLSRGLLAAGMRAFLIGWVYKAGLADNIAPLVDPVYNDIDGHSNLALIGATFSFAAQIYFDFAGYSLMAIGVARWFGYFIPKNFDFPYSSASIDEFWRRWHMSLSFWLRDYLYISLGGNRKGNIRTYVNLFMTMLLGGLWHGSAWVFVAWGALHGGALVVHRALVGRGGKIIGGVVGTIIGIAITQVFVVAVWAPFRADSFGDAFQVWSAFVGLREGGAGELPWYWWLAPGAVAVDHILGRSGWGERLARGGFFTQPAVYWGGMGLLVGCLAALYPLNPAPFVYFQF